MNIKQAKEYIKDAVRLYLKKDEFGEYAVPVVRQRPIFLLGAPGIGKTAIMEQIAQELGIALVSYSMTHHTRQSALGLPFITQKQYDGQTVSVSEYTMSEIIASVYETMEKSGIAEGILFLDEINCVSETLAPAMLQFLQYKVFGRHSVPEGWVIVTAGNPPEFNKSVREFDVVTMDRLKLLAVEADYAAWHEYALDRHIHAAVVSYLDLKKEHFYVMEMTTKGRSYVTARGWEDLSQMLYLYEQDGLKVEESLVEQYLHNEKVVKEFCAYYDLYRKYKQDYQIEEIMAGRATPKAVEKAKAAAFDERLSLMGLLLDRLLADMDPIMIHVKLLMELRNVVPTFEGKTVEETQALLDRMLQTGKDRLAALQSANSLSDADKKALRLKNRFLEGLKGEQCFDYASIKQAYGSQVEGLKEQTNQEKAALKAVFEFVENAFGKGNEMLIFVTQLTVSKASSSFIATFGSEEYLHYSKDMMLGERSVQIKEELSKLDL